MIEKPNYEEFQNTNIEYATFKSEGTPNHSEQEEQDNISFHRFFYVKMKHANKKMKEVRKEISQNLREFKQDVKEKSKEFREQIQRAHRFSRSPTYQSSNSQKRHPKYCPQCGHPVSIEGHFCPSCGMQY